MTENECIDKTIETLRSIYNSDMEKLTYGEEFLKKIGYTKEILESSAKRNSQLAEWLEELKSYRDAEEQGLLLRLPCKIGDKVYQIEDGYIYEFNARSIDVRKENEKYIFCIDSMDYKMDDFGKTVFLTKEEAEQALKQMGE